MALALYFAALLAFGIGVVHSVLGERYILTRLFRGGGVPKLFGGTEFTARTLRLAWHITTVAWCGFAALLVYLAQGEASPTSVAKVIGFTFIVTAIVTFVVSRARHLAWPVFAIIGGIALYVSAT